MSYLSWGSSLDVRAGVGGVHSWTMGRSFIVRDDGVVLTAYVDRGDVFGGSNQGVIYLSSIADEETLRTVSNSAQPNEFVFPTPPEAGTNRARSAVLFKASSGYFYLFMNFQGTGSTHPITFLVYRCTNGDGTNVSDWSYLSTMLSFAPLSFADSECQGFIGLPLELPSGRILVPHSGPFNWIGLITKAWKWCAFSDDGGLTWTHRDLPEGTIYDPFFGEDTLKSIGYSNGELFIMADQFYAAGSIYAWVSTDDGSHWTEICSYGAITTYGNGFGIHYGGDGFNYMVSPLSFTGELYVFRRPDTDAIPHDCTIFSDHGTPDDPTGGAWELISDLMGNDGYESVIVGASGYLYFFGYHYNPGSASVWLWSHRGAAARSGVRAITDPHSLPLIPATNAQAAE